MQVLVLPKNSKTLIHHALRENSKATIKGVRLNSLKREFSCT